MDSVEKEGAERGEQKKVVPVQSKQERRKNPRNKRGCVRKSQRTLKKAQKKKGFFEARSEGQLGGKPLLNAQREENGKT